MAKLNVLDFYMNEKNIEFTISQNTQIQDVEMELYRQITQRMNLEDYGNDNLLFYYHFVKEQEISKEEYKKEFQNVTDEQIQEFDNEINNQLANYIKNFQQKHKSILIKCSVFKDFHQQNFDTLKSVIEVTKKYSDNINVYVQLDSFDKQTLKNLVSLSQIVSIRNIVECSMGNCTEVTFAQTISAFHKAEKLVKQIKNADLSPLEQFIIIHDFCANRPYQEDDNWKNNCRSFIGSMTTEKIVCVGYAKLMNYFCEQLGIQCDFVTSENLKGGICGHAYNIVHLKDEKYNIRDTYLCDACWDCCDDSGKSGSYNYALFPMQDIQNDNHKDFYSQEIKNKYPYQSKRISFDTLSSAVKNAHYKFDNENINIKQITINLERTKSFMRNLELKSDKLKINSL